MALCTQADDHHWTNVQYSTSSTTGGGAIGERDVMIIASSHSTVAAGGGGGVVQRLPGSALTHREKEKLITQGVPRELQSNDLSIGRARFNLDKRSAVVSVVESDTRASRNGNCKLSYVHILEQIKNVLQHTKKHGVILHYIGPGRKHTGDWCFADGVITFADIASLYKRHFLGRVLTVVPDCSHSGSWVKACMEFLDKEGVKPCGHSARDKGILLKVYASCQHDEVATCTKFSVQCTENDKNTGRLTYIAGFKGRQIDTAQHACGVDFTKLRCGAKSIKEECLLHTHPTWNKWAAYTRVHLLLGTDLKEHRPMWQYVLLDKDDRDTVRRFREAAAAGVMDVRDYGEVLRTGWGEQPTNDIQEWIERRYNYISHIFPVPSQN